MLERLMLFDLTNDDALYDALIVRTPAYEASPMSVSKQQAFSAG